MAQPVIINSGGANLASLRFALQRLDMDVPVTRDAAAIRAASHVLLPGVGAARDAMDRLAAAGLDEVIRSLTQPVLGICLGMQLLFTTSEEDEAKCLDVIPGRAVRFPERANLPVPQMGWNELVPCKQSPLLTGIGAGSYAYFVHSYAVPVGDFTLATTDYGGPLSAVVGQDNFFGTQFHPERSARVGARILRNFLELPWN
jgi:glutamine amidotransferase